MIEIPESIVLADQLNRTIKGKTIKDVVVNNNPHKFAWFTEDPSDYSILLKGKVIGETKAYGSRVNIEAENTIIDLCEGINARYVEDFKKLPKKHQLLLEFEDGSYLACSVQMYGGLFVFEKGSFDNPYYLVSLRKPSPLSEEFNEEYYQSLYQEVKPTMSAKAFLATEQRIPGLGNGCLQDILFNALIHPKRKIGTLSAEDKSLLFKSIKATLQRMADQGGRNTEKDLFSEKGGYQTILSRFTVGKECPACGDLIKKASYLGGSVYFCAQCQPL